MEINSGRVRDHRHAYDMYQLVKQEMARVNVDILGISELKWTGMGEFNSDDLAIYKCLISYVSFGDRSSLCHIHPLLCHYGFQTSPG